MRRIWFGIFVLVGVILVDYGVRRAVAPTPLQITPLATPVVEGPPAPPRISQEPARTPRVAKKTKPGEPGPLIGSSQMLDSIPGGLPTQSKTETAHAAKTHDDLVPSPNAKACSTREFPGQSPEHIAIHADDWTRVIHSFHQVKFDLHQWLTRHEAMFSPEIRDAMDRELAQLMIQRPPAEDMLDLSWRGIGVWTRPAPGAPAMLRIGGGMVRLIVDDPARGKFELARLAAQTWTPCQLRSYAIHARGPASSLPPLSHALDDPWAKLRSCLSADDGDACGPGSYSEAGWAISTALATMVENPGCAVPAFLSPDGVACLKAGGAP